MNSLPSGTVTFLFTDIEGSTKLAQEHPDKWESLRARHHAILQSAMDAHNGYVFQIIGDAFCVAFHTAKDGLIAALTAQRALKQTSEVSETSEVLAVRVRMGLHTGSAEIHGNEYRGYMTLVRVQRVMSVAYGGQILLSNASAELIHNEMPDGISLRDMGEHRLKGLLNPEHLWQINAPGLPQEFPPLQSLNVIPTNLPVQLTNFVGREKEILEVKDELGKHRLITLTGSGGTGKTRLSLQVAADLLDSFHEGVWFIELASLSNPDLIPSTILSTLDISEQQGRPALKVLEEYLAPKKLLLVLDNCEHLIADAAKVANAILNAAPNLKILASSREALGVKGELSWHVPSLSLPDPKNIPNLEGLTQYEAVRLFIDRAALVDSHFAVTKDNAPAIAQICFRLDGIPLALELAAARVKMLSVDQISARLDDRFRLLTGGARTALPRQQTLRAMIDWSYNLLSEQEKTLFRRLAVFVGGWTLEAAESVCGGEGIESNEILDLLSQLLNKSLVNVEHVRNKSRYHRLETIHQYAREKLFESGESETIRNSHLQFFLKLAEVAKPYLYRSDAVEWHDRIEDDYDNFRLALDWAQQSEHNAESGLRIADALFDFWITRGYLVEGFERTSSALNHASAFERTALYANVLCNAAFIASLQGDFPGARSFANASLGIFRELDDKLGISYALQALGVAAIDSKDYALAESTLQEAFQNRRGLTDASNTSLLTTMGWAAFGLGDYALARQRLNEALTLSQNAGDRGRIAAVLGGLAEVDLREGKYESASKLIEENLTMQREFGDKWAIGVALGVWAWIAVLQQDWDSAFARLKESVAVRAEIGDKGGLVWCLEKLGQVALGKENPAKAAKIFSAAASLRTVMESAMDPFDQSAYERDIAVLHEKLGEEEFNTAWNQGRIMTLEKAIAYALEENS